MQREQQPRQRQRDRQSRDQRGRPGELDGDQRQRTLAWPAATARRRSARPKALSPEDVVALERRILAVLDEYVETEDQRRDRPAHGGILVLHRLAE